MSEDISFSKATIKMKFRRTYLTLNFPDHVWMSKCYLILIEITGEKWSTVKVGFIQEILDYGYQVGASRLLIGKLSSVNPSKMKEKARVPEILFNTTLGQIVLVHCKQEKEHFQAGTGRIYST